MKRQLDTFDSAQTLLFRAEKKGALSINPESFNTLRIPSKIEGHTPAFRPESRRIDLSLILPCYNEEPILAESFAKILATLNLSSLSYEIIFVDDKSKDRTAELLAKICRKYGFCRLITHKVNCGRGKSVVDGIKKAKGLVAGFIDIDLEVASVYIPEMVKMIIDKNADAVIGERVYRSSFSSLHREILSKGYLFLIDRLFDTDRLDTETGCKFFNRKKILPIIDQTDNSHWFWDTEVMVLSKRARLKIRQVPVLYLRRFDKKSTVRVLRDIKDYLVSLWEFRRRLKKDL